MAAEDGREANAAYYEIKSWFMGHHMYKSVWLAVVREYLYLENKSGNLHNDFAVAIIIYRW